MKKHTVNTATAAAAMPTGRHLRLLFAALALLLAAAAAPTTAAANEGHGPSSTEALSHNFQWQPHTYERPQLNVHFGLSQPLLLDGFNIAADMRVGRWVFEYSHGMNLDYNRQAFTEKQFVGDSGADLDSPWTTGAGVGYILLDDLYLMVEVKAHRYDLSLDGQRTSYTTFSVGPAVAYRLFLWKGLNLTAYLRYWPNVFESDGPQIDLAGQRFDAVDLGFFANLSLGWSFDLM